MGIEGIIITLSAPFLRSITRTLDSFFCISYVDFPIQGMIMVLWSKFTPL